MQKHGNHERSRVLELLRCKWGIPITTDRKGCYSVAESHLRRFNDDPDDVMSGWKEEAKKNCEYRQLYRLVATLSGLTGISRGARREVPQQLKPEFKIKKSPLCRAGCKCLLIEYIKNIMKLYSEKP